MMWHAVYNKTFVEFGIFQILDELEIDYKNRTQETAYHFYIIILLHNNLLITNISNLN